MAELRDASIVTADGARIAYRIRTGRDPWLLVHGLGCDASMWDGVVAALPADVGVVLPDLRGHGGSSLGWRAPSMDLWAEDVVAIIRRESLRHPAIGGLSMGGYTAFAIAAAHPRLARAWAFISTSAAPDDDAGRGRRAAGIETLRSKGWRPFTEGLLPSLIEPSRRDAAANRSRLIAMFARAAETGLMSALFALAARPDRRSILRTVTAPCAVVVGALDALTPPDRAEEIAAGLPDPRVVATIPNVAHMSAMEAPGDVARALLALG